MRPVWRLCRWFWFFSPSHSMHYSKVLFIIKTPCCGCYVPSVAYPGKPLARYKKQGVLHIRRTPNNFFGSVLLWMGFFSAALFWFVFLASLLAQGDYV